MFSLFYSQRIHEKDSPHTMDAPSILNEKSYNQLQRLQTMDRQELLEDLFNEVSKEFEALESNQKRTPKSKKFSEGQIRSLSCGEEISDAVDRAADPHQVENALSEFQIQMYQEYKRSKMEDFQSRVKSEVEKRISKKLKGISSASYVPLLRLRIMDLNSTGEVNSGTLTFWRPSDEVSGALKENKCFRISNVAIGFFSNNEPQLKATKSTRLVEGGSYDDVTFKRNALPIHEMVENADFQPVFDEVDTIGLLIKVENQEQMKSFQTVYLCDTMMNFVAVHFWSSIGRYGYENLIRQPKLVSESDANSIFYFRNLQWKKSQR